MNLLKGNCLDLMTDIPDKSIDMILCDLPYGTTACKWDTVIPFSPLWEQYHRIIKDNGAVALFSTQPFTTRLISSNLKNFRYCWYWKKNYSTGFSYARYQPMRCIEDICIFYKKAPRYNPQGLIKRDKPVIKKNYGIVGSTIRFNEKVNSVLSYYTNYPKHLLEFKSEVKDNRNRLHPTQKPVKLLEYLIKTYTNEGEVVLDNCMGSGSTGIACINTGRKFIGIEKDEYYFNVAENRISNHQKILN